jgi:hypothetical protein
VDGAEGTNGGGGQGTEHRPAEVRCTRGGGWVNAGTALMGDGHWRGNSELSIARRWIMTVTCMAGAG